MGPRRCPRMRMRWSGVQMAHWRVPPRRLANHLPPGLELDLWQGDAWVSVVALRVQRMRVGPIPLGNQDYAQCNVRTYVRRKGIPGIWLLGSYAADALACGSARLLGLPYWHSDVRVAAGAAQVRGDEGFAANWEPSPRPADRALDGFLTDRHHLFSRVGRFLLRIDASREPFQLRQADVRVEDASMLPKRLRGPADLAHVADTVNVRLSRPWRMG